MDDAFDAAGPLPRGLTVVEASAGTGKTYTLAALAVRYVAELDVPVGALCIVSFTEAATAELRGRVRERFAGAAEHLALGAPTTDDPVLTALAAGPTAQRAVRLQRLRDALVEFDTATITTIHGFCARVLATAGIATPETSLVQGSGDIAEVVNDLFLARYAHLGKVPFAARRVVIAAEAALAMPDATVWRPAITGQLELRRKPLAHLEHLEQIAGAAELIDEVVAEVRARREARRRRTFDGLLAQARTVLRSGRGGALAALRERYQIVLVDEFQDTDRVQWDIFRVAFGVGDRQVRPQPLAMVLVGDPKQSIYRFRGAELSTYLDAVNGSNVRHLTLRTNRRSDAPLLGALDALFTGFTFGADEVVFQPVLAAPGREHRAVSGAGAESLQVRVLDVEDGTDTGTVRRAVCRDVVAVVAQLLGKGVMITADGPARPLAPRDIAVLTRSNAEAAQQATELGRAGIAAATAASNSVLFSEAAEQWKVLLLALERPGSPGAVRAAALSWFVGHTPEWLAAAGDDDVAALHELLRDWSSGLTRHGLAHLLSRVRAGGLHARLLATQGGERRLTDLDHVAELLHRAAGGRATGPSAVLNALELLAAGSIDDEALAPEALARRIDRDDDAVQVLTVHRAKGLEFPVVLCPYLWAASDRASGIPHAEVDGTRQLDTTWVVKTDDKRTNPAVRDGDERERRGEGRRLLYVALTRAKHRCVVWWARGKGKIALADLFEHAGLLPDPAAWAHDDTIGIVSTGDAPVPVSVGAPDDARGELHVAEATRVLDAAWRIWSFTAITRATAAEVHGAEPPAIGGVDEEPEVPEPQTARTDAPPVTTLLTTAPAGAAFGTLVHSVLEQADFTSPTLLDDLTERCAAALRYRRAGISAADLGAGLADAIAAPLGGPLSGLRLADIARPDRLDELTFDIPLGSLRAAAIAGVLADHLPPDDLLRPWAAQAATGGFDVPVDGRLTGSIDLVARTTTADGATRYWLADYKTNQLGLTNGYTPVELAAAMAHHHYPLQATLYLVALHRYLRWRLPGYEPATHLGGAAYLFVRGMDPQRSAADARGVLWWQPPVAAIDAVDHVLGQGQS